MNEYFLHNKNIIFICLVPSHYPFCLLVKTNVMHWWRHFRIQMLHHLSLDFLVNQNRNLHWVKIVWIKVEDTLSNSMLMSDFTLTEVTIEIEKKINKIRQKNTCNTKWTTTNEFYKKNTRTYIRRICTWLQVSENWKLLCQAPNSVWRSKFSLDAASSPLRKRKNLANSGKIE